MSASALRYAPRPDPDPGLQERIVALVVRDGALVVAALEHLRKTMPFPLRGFDTDNGLPEKSRTSQRTELLSSDASQST